MGLQTLAGNVSAVRSLSVAAAPVVTPTPVPVPTAPVATDPPVVSGNPAVGRTLTASAGTWDQAGLTYAYQWLRDGVPVAGATSSSLVLGADDVDSKLSVQVTATRASGPGGVARSAESGAVVKAPSHTKLRLADRTPSAGQRVKLTAIVNTKPAAVGATGKVVIRVDGKVVRKVRLKDGKPVLLLAFKAGKHTVKISYAGSDSAAASSVKQKVRVKR